MKNHKLTQEMVQDYFNLLFRYPIYIEMFKQYSSWNQFSNFIKENNNKPGLQEPPEESITEFLYDNYLMFVEVEEKIEELESKINYEYPTFCFDFEKNKKYTEDELMDTREKIIYYTYLLKEYPQHITNRMSILSEKLNDMLLKGGYAEKHITIVDGINSELPNTDLLFPVPPQRYEQLITNELKYLNVQLGIEKLESENTPGKNSSKQKLKDEIHRLKDIVEENNKGNNLLTIKETLEYLKISRTTLHRLIKKQTFHYTIIGKKKYLNKSEIDKKMEIIDGKSKSK